MTSRSLRSSFFVTAGPLSRDVPCYVMRDADLDLHAAIVRGDLCYVLSSPQMGKSSLMIRMAARLREEGARAPVIRLSELGENVTAEQWYFGLLGRIGSQLGLAGELEEYWNAHAMLGPLQRWLGALRDVLLDRIRTPIVVFVDEIEKTRDLPFSADEFFTGIQGLYNERSQSPALQRLTFCLLGAATPSELIRDPSASFPIGHRVQLGDFTEKEAHVLLPGLHRARDGAPDVLRRIQYWTGGHPYLTQRLCQTVAQDRHSASSKQVDRICHDIFLSAPAREQNDHLRLVRDRMLRGAANPVELLTIYADIRAGKPVQDDPAHPLLSQLRLSGVVRSENGFLRVRNRIYERVFDQKFIEESQPLDEVARQRKAEQRGRRKVLAWAVPLVAIFASLALLSWWQWRRAQQASEAFLNIASASLSTASNVADEVHAASGNRPELLATYAQILETTRPLLEAMLIIEPRNVAANNLKAYGLYASAEDALHRGDTNAAASASRPSRALAKTLERDPDLRLRAIAARLYATAAEISSKLGNTAEAEQDVQNAEKLTKDVSGRAKPDDRFTSTSLSTAYGMLGAAEEGMDHWDRALQFREKNEGEQPKDADDRQFDVVHDALQQRNRMAQSYLENHQYEAARKILEERSLAIADTIVAWNNQPERHRSDAQRLQGILDLWQVQDQLAFVLAARKSTWPEALAYYQKAADAGAKLMPSDPSGSDHQRFEKELAAVARIQTLLGFNEDAQRSYTRYVAAVRERATAQSDDESREALGVAFEQWASFEAHHGSKSAAPADYQSALDSLSQIRNKDATVQREIASVDLKLAAVESGFGQADQARQLYRDSARASQRSIELDRRNSNGRDPSAATVLALDYQNLAFGELGSGDRNSAQEALSKMRDAAQAAVSPAQAALDQTKTLPAWSNAAAAHARLAWAVLLNGHVEESIKDSQTALSKDKPAWIDAQAWNDEQAWINEQAWMHANLAHGYLLANRVDQAKAIYLKHRGEEMRGEPFELSVLDDLARLRELGFDNPAMAEIEQLLGKTSR